MNNLKYVIRGTEQVAWNNVWNGYFRIEVGQLWPKFMVIEVMNDSTIKHPIRTDILRKQLVKLHKAALKSLQK